MRIRAIRLYRVCIPFKKSFKHSAAERAATDNIVVETELEDGSLGYGEGLPRDYVTGETPETVISSLKALRPQLFGGEFADFADALSFLEAEIAGQKNFPEAKAQNSARCALELSLLDAFSRSFREYLAPATGGPLYYSGVLSLESYKKNLWSGVKLKLFGFRQIKVKLGEDNELNLKILKALRQLFGPKVDLRVDVNGAWDLETAMAMAPKLRDLGISAVEQPLPHERRLEIAELRRQTSLAYMLDESLCDFEDAKLAVESGLCDIFNIRLSKCGGWLNSLKLVALARAHGLEWQLGCMVGESGILSAAGRRFAFLERDHRYLEGSYDRFLLKDNLSHENLSFGRRGRAGPIPGFGLGVEVDPRKLKIYSVDEVQLYG